jgi:hypothetical protein
VELSGIAELSSFESALKVVFGALWVITLEAEMAYKLFQRTGVRVDSPALTISAGGRIGINAAAVRVMVEAGVKAVLLFWDKTNNKIALKSAPKNDKNAYAVSLAPGHHSGTIRAKAFLAHIGWNARQTLPAEWNEKDKMFEVSLTEKRPGEKQKAKLTTETGA